MKNQGSSVTAIKHGSTLFRDEPKKSGPETAPPFKAQEKNGIAKAATPGQPP
ncbi:hypothetical protein L500_3288 [Bordetella holmesii CDC-H643-BH]|nr:hypothetical protein L500_3288 [Bordetella holmesii CDC-H643-BH]